MGMRPYAFALRISITHLNMIVLLTGKFCCSMAMLMQISGKVDRFSRNHSNKAASKSGYREPRTSLRLRDVVPTSLATWFSPYPITPCTIDVGRSISLAMFPGFLPNSRCLIIQAFSAKKRTLFFSPPFSFEVRVLGWGGRAGLPQLTGCAISSLTLASKHSPRKGS